MAVVMAAAAVTEGVAIAAVDTWVAAVHTWVACTWVAVGCTWAVATWVAECRWGEEPVFVGVWEATREGDSEVNRWVESSGGTLERPTRFVLATWEFIVVTSVSVRTD